MIDNGRPRQVGGGWRVVLALIGLVILGACQPAPEVSPIPLTPSRTPPLSPSPTVVWFPPTATHTPFPTREVTLTPDLRVGIGAILLEDDFSDPSRWDLAASLEGQPTILNRALTLAISEPRDFTFSIRRAPVLTDFYTEITVATSLCQGVDEFGLMLRVTPDLDYYRFSLSCDGQARLDRVVGGAAAALQPWTFATAALGAPGSARMGALVRGDELRLFIDNQHQFTIKDPMIVAGAIGLFARAAGDTAVTVSFSDLVVHNIEE